jgi:hypothetical protein
LRQKGNTESPRNHGSGEEWKSVLFSGIETKNSKGLDKETTLLYIFCKRP